MANYPEGNSISHFLAIQRSTFSNTQQKNYFLYGKEGILHTWLAPNRKKKIRTVIEKAQPSPVSQILMISLDLSPKIQSSSHIERDLGVKERKVLINYPNALFKQREW